MGWYVKTMRDLTKRRHIVGPPREPRAVDLGVSRPQAVKLLGAGNSSARLIISTEEALYLVAPQRCITMFCLDVAKDDFAHSGPGVGCIARARTRLYRGNVRPRQYRSYTISTTKHETRRQEWPRTCRARTEPASCRWW